MRWMAALLTLAGAAYGADPLLLSLLPPDAKLVAGLNMVKARETPFARYMFGRLREQDKGFEEFVAATGFDPRRDLTELIVAQTGEMGESGTLILARGTFDAARLKELLRGAGKMPETYKGIEIAGGKQEARSVAFLDGSTAVIGTPEAVRAAIDRREKPTQPDAALSPAIDELSASEHVWAVAKDLAGNLPLGSGAGVGGMFDTDLFRSLGRTSAALRFGDTVHVRATTLAKTDQDAAALADALRFMAQMAGAQASKTPGSTLGALLSALKLTSDQNIVRLALEIPEAELEKLIAPAAGMVPQ